MSLRIILLLFLGTWSVVSADKAHHHTDPASDSLSVPVITSGYSSAPKASASSSSVVAAAPPALSPDKLSSTVSELVSAVSEGANKDKLTERSDTYAAPSSSSSYAAPAPAAPASTGNLYYYYYPVAAYPIYDKFSGPHPSHGRKPNQRPSYGGGHNKQVLRNKDSSGSSGHHSSASSGGYGGLDEASDFTPFLFMIIPLVAATVAFLVLISIQGNNNNNGIIGRSFGDGIGGITSAFLGRSSELDEKFGSFSDLQAEIDLLLAKYVQALDSDQCMDRIVCELGVKASRIPSKGLLFR